MTRDANLRSDDRIEILLDTYRDQRNAFYFATNPAGALVDGLLFTNGRSNMNWDAIWTVRTLRTNQGWSAEFAIPFKSLSFPSGRTVWGFNVARYIQRKLEDDRWSGARLETQFFQVSEAGEITNLDDLTQGIGLDIRPFAGARWLHRSGDDDTTITGKPGFDVFYNFTPSLKLSATVNTDFGETEVDARQINLTRFSLFFPEKRAFFLENAGLFSFSETAITTIGADPSTCCQVIPFFSRQIGLLAGTEVPLDVGVKLTGRVGRTDVGVLDVRTRDVSTVPAKNFLVARVKQNFLQQSYIGAIVTDGHPGLSIGSRTYGADVRLATSDFLGKAKNLSVNAYGLRSVNEGTSNKDGSYGVSVDYPNDFLDMEFAWREVEEDFRPGLGFVSRRNVRVLRAGGRVHPRLENGLLNIRDYVHGAFYTRFTRLDNGLVESSKLHLAILDWHFRSGDGIHALFSPAIVYERVFTPFEISPGVVLPPGQYRFTRFRTIVMSAAKRRLAGSANWRYGNYWSGRADEVTTNVSYKMPPRFIVSLNIRQTFARLPQGNFTTRIVTSQVNYTASPFLSLSNLVQYDNRSLNLGWQSRIRWILQPGNDLFLVFTQGWIQDATDDHRFRAQDTKFSTKLHYTSRF